MNFIKWLGLGLWTIGVVGVVGTLFVDEFLGRTYTEWAIAMLIGWCSWLLGRIDDLNCRITGVAIRQVTRETDR